MAVVCYKSVGNYFDLKLLLGAFLLLFIFAPASQGQVSVSGWTPPSSGKAQDPDLRLSIVERAVRGKAPLSRKYPHLRIVSIPAHRLPAPDPDELKQKDSKKRLRIGIIRQFPQPIDALTDSASYQVAEGRLRLFSVASEGAAQLRLHFTRLELPQGARLFIYSAKNPDQFYGPIANKGEDGSGHFWTPPMDGDEVVVEYFSPLSVEISGTKRSPFVVAEISHVFSDPRYRPQRNDTQTQTNCQLDVPNEWSETAKSVALLQFILPDGDYLCSGTLLNTVSNSGTPYLLTANHCFDTRLAASSLKVYWLYNTGIEPPEGGPVSYGSNLLATGAESDFTFVRLNNSPPDGVRYSGWTTERVPDSTTATGIHHPEGERVRIAFGNTVGPSCPEDLPPGFCENFLKVRWNSGVTAPGSSGSGLWIGPASDPKLAATLLGGLSACENRSGVDYYGRFDITFEAISYFLTERGCFFSTSLQKQFAEATGATGQVEVLAREGEKCAWTAQSNTPWVTINSGSSGTDEGVIRYSVAPNTTANRRAGMLNIGGRKLVIFQSGAGQTCTPSTISLGQSVNANLGSSNCRSIVNPGANADRYTFTAEAGQSLAVRLDSLAFDAYLVLLGPNGETLGENDNFDRGPGARIPGGTLQTGGYITMAVSGIYTIEVTSVEPGETGAYTLQLERNCLYGLATRRAEFSAGNRWLTIPDNQNFLKVEFKQGDRCQVAFESDTNWLSGYAFNDGTQVVINTQTNDGRFGRAGTLKIAGFPVVVKQAAFCNESSRPVISPVNRTVSGPGGQFSVDVTMAPGAYCTWNTVGDRPPIWITMQDIFSIEGTGNGKVNYSVFAHDGIRPRSGGFTVANQKHTITQEPIGAGCSTSPMPFGQSVSGALSQSDCSWIPLPQTRADHYTFNGLANQQVSMELEATDAGAYVILFDQAGERVFSFGLEQPGKARFPRDTGYWDLPSDGVYTIVVYGNPGRYTMRLDGFGGANCSYRISTPQMVEILPAGGNGNIELTATSDCLWTAKSDADWVTFPDGSSGKGSKNILFSVAQNSGAARLAAITIANRTVIISQDAPCSYIKVSQKVYVKDSNDSFPVWVETGKGCQFTAISRSAWITLGSINPTVAYFKIEKNNGPFRKGIVEVGGQTVEVYQGATNLEFFSAADYRPLVAPGSIASIFSDALSLKTESATRVPLPTLLADTSVTIYFSAGATFAPLFYVSPAQINLQIPEQINTGKINFQVWTSDGASSTGSVNVVGVAPSLFSANASGQGIAAAVALRIKANGAQIYEPVAQFDSTRNKFIPLPIDLGDTADQVFLLLFGTGIRNRSALEAVSATIGGENAEVLFAGPQGGFVGLDQVNVRLSRSLIGRGEIDLVLKADGIISNTVKIGIK